MTPQPHQIHFEDETLRLTSMGCVLAATWMDTPQVEHLRAFRRTSIAMQKHHPGGTAAANLICDGTPHFDSAVREEVVSMFRATLHGYGMIHAVLVEGLRGTATRAFLSTAILVGRPRSPQRVLADIDSAAQQLVAWLPPEHAKARSVYPEMRAFLSEASRARYPSWVSSMPR